MYKKLDETALEAILEAGIEEFARCGFQPASIADVAKKAGVSVGVIYKYYNDKETFFLACVRHSLDLLDQTLQEVIAAGGSLEDRVRPAHTVLITQSRQHASYNAMYNEITAGAAGSLRRCWRARSNRRRRHSILRFFPTHSSRASLRTRLRRSCLRFSSITS